MFCGYCMPRADNPSNQLKSELMDSHNQESRSSSKLWHRWMQGPRQLGRTLLHLPFGSSHPCCLGLILPELGFPVQPETSMARGEGSVPPKLVLCVCSVTSGAWLQLCGLSPAKTTYRFKCSRSDGTKSGALSSSPYQRHQSSQHIRDM